MKCNKNSHSNRHATLGRLPSLPAARLGSIEDDCVSGLKPQLNVSTFSCTTRPTFVRWEDERPAKRCAKCLGCKANNSLRRTLS